MDISKYTISDFVFDEGFRKWVLNNDPEMKNHWQMVIQDNPEKRDTIQQAKRILIDYQNLNDEFDSKEIWEVWENIDLKTELIENNDNSSKPLAKQSNTQTKITKPNRRFFLSQWKSVAAIIIWMLSLGILISYFETENTVDPEITAEVIKKVETKKGEKSSFVLQDGTEVIVNSGSTLKFKKNFDTGQREIFLEGEAYFKVARDTLKPFRVVSFDDISVTALGTSFMIQAYPNEQMKVSLLTGKVKVKFNSEKDPVYLEKGEGLKINIDTRKSITYSFNTDQVLAWTKKTIYFDEMPISEAIRTLENWYGVQFSFKNKPPDNLLLTGTFENETLKNVLEGLKYTSGIQYDLKGKNVTISFKH